MLQLKDISNYSPQSFKEFVGQKDVVESLLITIKAAKKRGVMPDHILLCGPAGCGKTSAIRIVVHEYGGYLVEFAGGMISKKEDIYVLVELIKAKAKLFIFIDEIHRIPKRYSEALYTIMQDFVFDGDKLPKFTLVGASTTIGNLPKPLRDRFKHTYTVSFYSNDDIKTIVKNVFKNLNDKVATEIALRSHGVPRVARNLLTEVCNTALNKGRVSPTVKDAEETFFRLKIDGLGLRETDRDILRFLHTNQRASEKTLASIFELGQRDLNELHETFLMRLGLISKSNRGRSLTELGEKYITQAP